MFNSTFFKFLMTFVALILVSFLIMGFASDIGANWKIDHGVQKASVK